VRTLKRNSAAAPRPNLVKTPHSAPISPQKAPRLYGTLSWPCPLKNQQRRRHASDQRFHRIYCTTLLATSLFCTGPGGNESNAKQGIAEDPALLDDCQWGFKTVGSRIMMMQTYRAFARPFSFLLSGWKAKLLVLAAHFAKSRGFPPKIYANVTIEGKDPKRRWSMQKRKWNHHGRMTALSLPLKGGGVGSCCYTFPYLKGRD